MSNEWKDRVIRGGIVVVCAMGLIGAMGGLTGIIGRVPRGSPGKRHHPRRGLLHRCCIRHRRQHPQPVADGQTTMPPGPAPSLETPRDTQSGMSRGIQGRRQPSTTFAGSPDSA